MMLIYVCVFVFIFLMACTCLILLSTTTVRSPVVSLLLSQSCGLAFVPSPFLAVPAVHLFFMALCVLSVQTSLPLPVGFLPA